MARVDRTFRPAGPASRSSPVRSRWSHRVPGRWRRLQDASVRDQGVASRRTVSVVVPTYREVENIPRLVSRIEKVRENAGLDLELLLMDDDSRDGSDRTVASLGLPWVRLVTR